jgi:transmembrane 9 superfamily protein 1
VQVDLSEDVVMEDSAVAAEFTYSVTWRETDTPYEKRMDKYRRYSFLPQHLEVSFKNVPLFYTTG